MAKKMFGKRKDPDFREKEASKKADKRKNDPIFRQSEAAAQAEYRKYKFVEHNSTIQARRRIFNDSVKHGPIFDCISCRRLLYDNAVIRIKDSEKASFEEKLNETKTGHFKNTIIEN